MTTSKPLFFCPLTTHFVVLYPRRACCLHLDLVFSSSSRAILCTWWWLVMTWKWMIYRVINESKRLAYSWFLSAETERIHFSEWYYWMQRNRLVKALHCIFAFTKANIKHTYTHRYSVQNCARQYAFNFKSQRLSLFSPSVRKKWLATNSQHFSPFKQLQKRKKNNQQQQQQCTFLIRIVSLPIFRMKHPPSFLKHCLNNNHNEFSFNNFPHLSLYVLLCKIINQAEANGERNKEVVQMRHQWQ